MSFRVTLPEAGGVIDGTFIDLTGRPTSALGTPPCDDASEPSTLVMCPLQQPVK